MPRGSAGLPAGVFVAMIPPVAPCGSGTAAIAARGQTYSLVYDLSAFM